MRAPAAVVVLLAGCTDYAVHVDFDIPAAYRPDVATVSLAVVVPPPAQPFDCDALAFGEVDDDTVRLATVQEVSARDQERVELSGIPRTGDKLFYAVGSDDQELALVAGCAELGEVSGEVDVAISGEPTTVVALPGGDPGNPLPTRVPVLVADARGEPLASADVRFTVTGPADEVSTGTARTDDRGRVDLEPVAPALPGPAALDVRARWARMIPDSLLGFAAPPPLFSVDLPGTGTDLATAGPEALFVVGRLGPAGEPGFAGLGPSDGAAGGRQILLAWYDATRDPPFRTVTSPSLFGVFAIGLISHGGRDQVLAMNAASWIELDSSGATTSHVSPAGGRTAVRIVAAGGCDSEDVDRVLVAFADDSFAVYDADRNPVVSPFDDEPPGNRIAGSGCVSATTGDLHRTVVFSTGMAQQTVVADMDVPRHGNLIALGLGVGFAPVVGDGEAALLAGAIDVSGVSIGRWRLAPLAGANLELEEITADDAAAPPASAWGGDLDGDGELDVAALLTLGERDGTSQFRVMVSLSVDHLGGRLVGLSATSEAVRPRLLLRDFDGDGIDDVLIVSPGTASVLRLGP